MKESELAVGSPPLSMRRARFEDVAAILRLIERAVEHGCRGHYDACQRRAVFVSYASSLFVDVLGPCETLVAQLDGRLVGAAQLDPRAGLLRALFVDAELQGRGVGHALLAAVEARARAAHCGRLYGAMSLNAVPFYRRAGFHARGVPERVGSGATTVPVLWMAKLLDE